MREAILTVASRLYRTKGATALSMRRVAGELGVAPNTIYRHFENKDDLIHQILEAGRREFSHLLHGALDAPNARARFYASVEAYLEFVVTHTDYYAALFVTPRAYQGAPLPDAFRERRPATFQFLVDRVDECMREGVFRRDDSVDVAFACWSQIHGFAALYVAGFFAGDAAALRAAVRRCFDQIINGIGEPGQ